MDDKHHGYRPIINASVQLTFKRRKNHPKNQMRLIEKNEQEKFFLRDQISQVK